MRGSQICSPETLDYYFEKIFSGADSPKSPDGEWARMHVKMISDILREFRAKLEERGILNQHSTMEYYLKEVEYPTSELLDYVAGSGSLKDHRAANIFIHFLQDKMRSLEKIAAGIDEEYASEEGA